MKGGVWDAESGVCCGMHAVCERLTSKQTPVEKPEYYDDEELDRFALRPSDSYSEAEEEEFREVLYTMLEEDVPGWLHSLGLRQINLPDSLRAEALLLVGE